MNSKRKKRGRRLVGVCLLLLVATPELLTWREVRQQRLNHDLIAAVRSDDTAAVRSLLHQGADPNAPALSDNTHPWWQRLWDILRHRPSPRSPVYITALFEAVDYAPSDAVIDNADTVKALADAGANVNFCDGHRRTPLLEAASLGKWSTLQVLLRHHADVNAAGENGMTALMLAAADSDTKIVETLLNSGANPNTRNESGDTALMIVLYPHIAKMGIENVDMQITTTMLDERETVACLLQHGASVEGRNIHGDTVMALALRLGDKPLIQMLEQAGAK